jgi:NhaA family Na+:H+ antiporter
MNQHVLTHHAASHPSVRHQLSLHRQVAQVWRFMADRFLLLPIGAALALIWANTAGESYFRFSHALSFTVNEVAMAFFLALVAQELYESLMPGGALHTWRRWGTTVIAAAGGIAGTAAVYIAYVTARYEMVLVQAWPVACAIDIAASYYVMKLVFRRSAVLPFILLVAVATDLFGLIIVGMRPPLMEVRPGGIVLMLSAIGLAALMRQRKVRSFWPYIAICGTLSWTALFIEGVHPALALIPIVPFLPHEPRRADPFADPRDDDDVHHFEHEWNGAVQAVLFLFGLVNAGVQLRGYDTGTLGILAATLIGRPVGLLATVAVAVALGMHLPRRVGWRELVVLALATSSGFTFALFFATGLLPPGPVLSQIKVGVLASVAGAAFALIAGRVLGVGRFAPARR